MKKIKKIMAVFLTMLLVMGMAATVNAAEQYTITINNSTKGHTYTAYQIFKGDLDTTSAILSNIEWGSGVDGDALLAALKDDTSIGSDFTDCTTAADAAKVLEDYSNDSDELQAFAAVAKDHLKSESGTSSVYSDSKYTITGLDAGYYLVRDTGTVSGDDAATRFILKLAGDVEVTPKSKKPSVEKKVQEDDKYQTDNSYETGYNDVADYDIGSDVPFKLIGTVPDMTGYETYQYIFHDTLSTGLSLNAESIKVYLAESKNADLSGLTPLVENTNYTVTKEGLGDGCTFEIKITDLTKIPNISSDKFIIVAYTAKLTSDAVVGLNGNTNAVQLEYSNDPYNTTSTGETVKDEVLVFTYKLDTTKTDIEEPDTKLQDAKFVLLSSDGTKVAKVNANDKLVEWVAVSTVASSGKPTLDEWETFDGGLRDPEGTDKVILTSDSKGLFSVTGLDAGTYKLREIQAPDGYNLLTDDVEVVITAATANGQNWNGTDADADALRALTVKAANKDGTGDVNTGTASITIGNGKGIQLPSTGGAGTTLFYIAGAILAVGAGVFLIVRRRMGSDR